jgi:transcriptional regulator with XRE-family HTH domain
MGETTYQRLARRRAPELRRSVGEAVRRLREDAGLTQAAVARASGVDPSYLARIEAGAHEPGFRVLAAIGAVLGADVSVRLFPTTGPRIHDRWQAPMEECLIRAAHRRWIASPEVLVTKPSRGVIDVTLGELTERLLVATEINSQLRRLEQQVRWHREKEASLPSSDLWPFMAADGPPRTSRLLVLRSTVELRHLAATYEETLRAAYPARTVDALASLTGTDPWPGAAIVWIHLHGREARLMDGPPRGVALGR